MTLRSCIITLLIVYPAFLAAGIWFYRHMQKIKPQPFPVNDRRNSRVRVLRFMMYIVLLPLGTMISLAILGWLDPLFHLIVNIRR